MKPITNAEKVACLISAVIDEHVDEEHVSVFDILTGLEIVRNDLTEAWLKEKENEAVFDYRRFGAQNPRSSRPRGGSGKVR